MPEPPYLPNDKPLSVRFFLFKLGSLVSNLGCVSNGELIRLVDAGVLMIIVAGECVVAVVVDIVAVCVEIFDFV